MINSKLAAIDIGTNSFHMVIVGFTAKGDFEIVDRSREVIRLSEGSKGDIKFISEAAIIRGVETLKRFKGIADSHKAIVRAVATSAVRESSNQLEFIKKVYHEAGVEIEVISGEEEARLIYLGVCKAVPVYNKKTLCIDIGGGSTEFLLGQNGQVLYANSLKVGAVRLSQKFFPDFDLNKERIKECTRWVEGEIYPVVAGIAKIGFDVCVGSSGTVQSTAIMDYALKTKEEPDFHVMNNYLLTNTDVQQVTENVLSKETLLQRQKIKGLEDKRADVIPGGIILLNTIFKSLGLKEMLVSEFALREGIILDSLEKYDDEILKSSLHNIRMQSVKHLAEISQFDQKHCEHVSALSKILFDGLKEIHQLKDSCFEFLEAASLLHDIGYHIAHSKHHKHSYYIIRNCSLLGFNDLEISLIANIARYHRKSHPKSRHPEFEILPKNPKETVRKLASILRISDAFDRTHSFRITDIKIELNENEVILQPIFQGDVPEIEIWSFERRRELFEEVFNRKVVLKI
ncbi:MAG: Ppx/GppA phosphatase family protein [Bacteroidota bacterium]